MSELVELERAASVRVAAICAREGITRDELAQALGVSRDTLWRWSRALSSPPPKAEAALRGLEAGRLVFYRGSIRRART